jgi:hypothetical protein
MADRTSPVPSGGLALGGWRSRSRTEWLRVLGPGGPCGRSALPNRDRLRQTPSTGHRQTRTRLTPRLFPSALLLLTWRLPEPERGRARPPWRSLKTRQGAVQ